MRPTASLLLRAVQLVFLLLLVAWLVLSFHSMLHPRDAFSRSTDAFFTHGHVLLLQLVYPVFVLLTRGHEWPGAWRWLRVAQGTAVGLVVLGFLLLLLATPDVSGFRN